jgi:hypothetical protein
VIFVYFSWRQHWEDWCFLKGSGGETGDGVVRGLEVVKGMNFGSVLRSVWGLVKG